MRIKFKDRVIGEAKFIIRTGATVRATAKEFNVGKSTVHKDMTVYLYSLNNKLYKRVRKVLDINLAQRHIRGGEATRQKYLRKKQNIDEI